MVKTMAMAAALGAALAAMAGCAPPHPHGSGGGPLRAISRLDCPSEQGDLSLRSQTGDGTSCDYQDDSGDVVKLRLMPINAGNAQAALAPLEHALGAELPASAAPSPADHDHVDINLPGVQIHAGDDGARVNAGGQGGHKGVVVNANDNGAQIRIQGGGGVRSDFLLVSDTPGPNGYKFVGYEARGPASGPVVVAQMMGKDTDHDELDHDVRHLLDRNVGG